MELDTLQSQFQAYLKEKEMATLDEHLSTIINPAAPTYQERLRIYHHAYRARLLEVLRDDFPKLLLLLGDAQFNQLSLQYIEKTPSHHFSVRYFGEKFPHFLKERLDVHPALSELADFEWTLGNCIDAPDSKIITKSDFLQIQDSEQPYLKLMFHPSVCLKTFTWQPMQIWQALQSAPEENVAAPTQQKIPLLFWRKAQQAYFRSLSEQEAKIFILFSDGGSLSEVCEKSRSFLLEEEIPRYIGQYLQTWLQAEIISGYKLDN